MKIIKDDIPAPKNEYGSSMEVDQTDESLNKSSFGVLLHASLKSENMVAIVTLGSDWFGAVHCWQENKNDPKKKSNLMFTMFVPGSLK